MIPAGRRLQEQVVVSGYSVTWSRVTQLLLFYAGSHYTVIVA